MITKSNLIKISPVLWEISKNFRSDMRVPARIFATEQMLDEILKDRSLEQLVNVATLPGIQGWALAMPDAHEGYGFPIGGVAAVKYPDGVISPGGIGYDINCGVRLLKSNLDYSQIKDRLEDLAKKIYKIIPSGVGQGGKIKISKPDLDNVLENGVNWAIKQGYADQNDLNRIESDGCMPGADSDKVSQDAKDRGLDQLGTLGSGNHFAEIDFVDEIYDEQTAQAFGLRKNQIVVLIHTGSRGLGHQVATDYIRKMMAVMGGYGITLPDRELACVPFSSPEGKDYFSAMSAAANFAWTNRQLITWQMRNVWEHEFGESEKLTLLYDLAHNIAKIETHELNGKKQPLLVHRKGATRAFGPNHPELPAEFRLTGQPVLIPGSMGTSSYVLAGCEAEMALSFGSSCHGAGRKMSRSAAKKIMQGKTVREKLFSQGIHVQAGSMSDLAEEAPFAYKDVDQVIEVVHAAGIAKKVARLKPCVVIKG
jgi:tRNA-splicing ligase RtcB